MLNIQNLYFSYISKKLYNNLNLELETGKIYGLLGKNGAGKSTLFKLISGLIIPKNGEISVNGLNPSQRTRSFYNNVFYYPEVIRLPNLIINDFIKNYSKFYINWNQIKFEDLLSLMDLSIDKRLSNLSHGQLKKFYLAFALATECSYILLDEPTSGLDIPSKRDFRKFLINSINDNQSIIISSHQVKDFNKLLDEIIIIDSGEIIFKHSLYDLDEKLSMNFSISEDNNIKSFYSEDITGGTMKLVSSKDVEEHIPLDIEILFNAVISNHKEINLFMNSNEGNSDA